MTSSLKRQGKIVVADKSFANTGNMNMFIFSESIVLVRDSKKL